VRAGRSFLSAVDGRNLVSAHARDCASATESGPNRGNLLSVDRVPTLKSQAAVLALDEGDLAWKERNPGS